MARAPPRASASARGLAAGYFWRSCWPSPSLPMVWMVSTSLKTRVRRDPAATGLDSGRADLRAIHDAALGPTASGRSLPPLLAKQHLGFTATTVLGVLDRRARGLRLLALPLPRAGPALLLGAGAEHVPGRRLPDPALHPDEDLGLVEHPSLADPDLSHVRAAAFDLAAQRASMTTSRRSWSGRRGSTGRPGSRHSGRSSCRSRRRESSRPRSTPSSGLERIRLRSDLPQLAESDDDARRSGEVFHRISPPTGRG